MRFVAIADTHQTHRYVDVPAGDVLLVAGDVCLKGSIPELLDFLQWAKELSFERKIMIAGNHDICFEETPEPCHHLVSAAGVEYLFESYTFVGDKKVWGAPWTPEFYNWAFNLERGEQLRRVWSKIPDDTDILLTHGPPHGVGDMAWEHGVTVHDGDRELGKALGRVKPSHHVFGHFHMSYGMYDNGPVTCINASCVNEDYEPVNEPVVFDVD